jgi:high-affinity Fe2+/Pb2+ permease
MKQYPLKVNIGCIVIGLVFGSATGVFIWLAIRNTDDRAFFITWACFSALASLILSCIPCYHSIKVHRMWKDYHERVKH